MKRNIYALFGFFIIAILLACNSMQTLVAQNKSQTEVKKQVVPGEQTPLANPGQNNFGGMRPPTGSGGQKPAIRQPRPEPEVRTVSLDENVPRCYNVPTNRTQLLVADSGDKLVLGPRFNP